MRNTFGIRAVVLALAVTAMTFLAAFSSTAGTDKDKMSPQDLIAKHLESIGPVEARASATSRVFTGTVVAKFRQGGYGQTQGKAVMASQGSKNLIAMVFGLPDYPHEKFAYDGQKVTVSSIKPGVRTLLGRFLSTNGVPFREGLAGGTLSAAWPLLDFASKNVKVQYDGLKKVEGKQLHALKYNAPKSSDLKVTLFFDPATFQHVRTEYHQVIDNPIAASKPGQSMEQQETRIDLVETFSDFRAESKLMLPHSYKLQLTINGQSGSLLNDWMVSLTQFEIGQLINEKEFDLEAN